MTVARRLLLAVVIAGAAASCRHREPVPPTMPGERAQAARKVPLIESPRHMREDTVYPPGKTRQAFHWQDHKAEWRFRLPAQGFAYAGFRFLTPHNLGYALDAYALTFTIRPAGRARHLWLGLVDGDDARPNVYVEVPLDRYLGDARSRAEVKVRIPLRDFPLTGHPVLGEDGYEHSDPAPFDWRDVREIRFTHPSGRMPAGDVVVTDLMFRR